MTYNGELLSMTQTPFNFRFSESIEVLVGDSKTRFTFHPHILHAPSPFFEAAYKRWKKENEPPRLTDEEPETFKAYLSCVYRREIPHPQDEDGHLSLLADIYMLADKLGDLGTANSLVDELLRFSKENNVGFGPNQTEHVWNHTSKSSPLRKILIDLAVHELSDESFEPYAALMPVRMLVAVATELKKLGSTGGTRRGTMLSRPKCYYHQHNGVYPICEGQEAPQSRD